MVEQSADVICYLVSDRFTYVSPSASTIFGWNPQGMIGTTGLDLIYEPDLPILEEVLTRRTSGEESGSIRHQLRVICGDGSLKWSETSAHSERDPAGEMRTALIIRDISDRKHLEQEVQTGAVEFILCLLIQFTLAEKGFGRGCSGRVTGADALQK